MNLFAQDNFSDSKIKYENVDVGWQLFYDILKNYFDGPVIKSVYKVGGTAAHSENFKITLNDGNAEKEVLVRKHKTLQASQIEFYSGLAHRLRKLEAKMVVPFKTIANEWMVIIGGEYYQVYRFILAEHFYPSEDSFCSIAKALAQLHLAFNALDSSDLVRINTLSQHGDLYFNVIKTYSEKDFINLQNIINKRSEQTEIDKEVLSRIPYFIGAVKEVKNQEQDIENLSKQIIHSDTHPHNFLIKNNDVEAILDLGGMRVSQQARDVAHAIYRLGRQFFVHNVKEQTEGNAIKLKDVFIESYKKVKNLSDKEMEMMPYLLKDEFIRKNLFVLNGVYKQNNRAWASNLSKFLIAMDEIKFFWPS